MQHTLLQNDLWPSEEVHDGTWNVALPKHPMDSRYVGWGGFLLCPPQYFLTECWTTFYFSALWTATLCHNIKKCCTKCWKEIDILEHNSRLQTRFVRNPDIIKVQNADTCWLKAKCVWKYQNSATIFVIVRLCWSKKKNFLRLIQYQHIILMPQTRWVWKSKDWCISILLL